MNDFYDAKENKYLLQPHPAQVITIMRLMGIGSKQGGIRRHITRVNTGEGKSIILGAMSSLLAVLGYKVHCVCYSKYLSHRDYNDFIEFFDLLKLRQRIEYSTLDELCVKFIHEGLDISKAGEEFFFKEDWSESLKEESEGVREI